MNTIFKIFCLCAIFISINFKNAKSSQLLDFILRNYVPIYCSDGTYLENGKCELCPVGYECQNNKKLKCQSGFYANKGYARCLQCREGWAPKFYNENYVCERLSLDVFAELNNHNKTLTKSQSSRNYVLGDIIDCSSAYVLSLLDNVVDYNNNIERKYSIYLVYSSDNKSYKFVNGDGYCKIGNTKFTGIKKVVCKTNECLELDIR